MPLSIKLSGTCGLERGYYNSCTRHRPYSSACGVWERLTFQRLATYLIVMNVDVNGEFDK